MSGPTETLLEARSYELDPYGHVNNAVFVNWFEHGRLCYLRERGLTFTSIPEDFAIHVLVVKLEVVYRAQVCLGDEMTMGTRITQFGKSSFTFEQTLSFPDGKVAAACEATMVCVDRQARPRAMPPELKRTLDS